MSELKIERVYPVGPMELFAYIADPEKLVKWWGPDGATVLNANLDFARTGPWSLTLQTPRGAFEMGGTVKNVAPPRFVEFSMNVPGQDGPDSLVRFEVAPEGNGGSRLILIQSGITDAMVEMGKRGWGSTLDRLGKTIDTGLAR